MKYEFKDLVIDARTGLNPRKNFKLGIGTNNYITIKDIHDGKIRISDKTDKIDDNARELINKRSRIKINDVLFSSIGRIGETAIVERGPTDWNINESVFCFTLDSNIITNQFFCWMFNSPNNKRSLLSNSTGSTFPSIKMNQLNRMIFDIPPIDKQNSICNELNSIKKARENANERLIHLDSLIKSRFIGEVSI